jgi:cytochrome c6
MNERQATQTTNGARMKKLITLAAILSVTAALTASAADSKENWNTLCKKCHGEDGKGQTVMGKKNGAKDYTDPKVHEALKDEAAFKAIKEGFKDKDGKVLMKPAEGLSDDDIKALVGYMRAFKK